MMYAVIRETTYAGDLRLEQTAEFREFQDSHAARNGYRGTLLTRLGDGRYVTTTLWDTEQHMNAAREALGPIVQRLLDPMMKAPSKLYGTGEVTFSDLIA